jgi:hypothetical protein
LSTIAFVAKNKKLILDVVKNMFTTGSISGVRALEFSPQSGLAVDYIIKENNQIHVLNTSSNGVSASIFKTIFKLINETKRL